LLGEKLYPLAEKFELQRPGKVTGMLLQMNEAGIVDLIKSPEALRAQVSEAMDVLRKAQIGGDIGFSNLSLDESHEN
jgi:polyadenylate-binding protein